MVQTFPMALDEFFEGLPIQSFKSDLSESMEYNQDASGAILTADMGPRLWKNDIIVRTGNYGTIEQIKARLNLLRYPNRSLFVHAMPFIAPQADFDGSILGASVITLTDVDGSNNRVIELSGFPAGYQLTAGDFMSFTYSSNPIRYAMHQFAESAVADGAGVMTIEVSSFIRPGYVLGSTVTLIKPYYKAVVVPGSTDVGSMGGQFGEGVKFSVVQTLGR